MKNKKGRKKEMEEEMREKTKGIKLCLEYSVHARCFRTITFISQGQWGLFSVYKGKEKLQENFL